jgi:UDP-3-O-[3-hydroxymyristoyl] N-acetylglucosamine deacetylase
MRIESMRAARQTTLRDDITISGIGVHSGLPVTLSLHPADADTGIVFVRSGPDGEHEVRAEVQAVTTTDFATVLGNGRGPLVSTAEHLLSALHGLGVDNVVIEIDGPEVPILDGSAGPFVAAIDQVGVVPLNKARRYIQVLKPVRVVKNGSYGEIAPHRGGFRVEIDIEFDHPLIGRQSLAVDVEPDPYRRELARARTFGFLRDVTKLWSAGYALGASFDNTLVVSDDRVLNSDGLRYPDEFVRHKVLDAVGDLALAGQPLLAAYRTVRGGHKLNHAVLSALIADPTAWRVIEVAESARRVRGQAQVAAGLPTPAFGPEVS